MKLCTIGATLQTVDAEARIVLLQVSRLELGKVLDGREAAVLGQSERNGLERLAEGAHRVLLERGDLVAGLRHGERARDLGRAAAIHDAVVADQIAHHAEGVVEGALGLLDDHLVATANEDGHGARILALLDDEHAILGRAERELAHLAREAELLGRQLAETWHNAAAGGDRDQLQNDHKFKN